MGIESSLNTPLAGAVRTIGSQSAFGRLIGRSQTWVYQALQRDRRLPAEHVIAVETATGISRHDLRPDIYPRDDVQLAVGDQARPAAMELAR